MKKLVFTLLFVFSLISVRAEESILNLPLSMPAYDWCIWFKLDNYKITGLDYKRDGSSRTWELTNSIDSSIIYISFDKNKEKISSEALRDTNFLNYKKSRLLEESKTKFFNIGCFAGVDYDFKSAIGTDLPHHSNLYLSKEDIWVNIHITKPKFRDSDTLIFNKIKNSFQFSADYQDAISDCYSIGTMYEQNQDFRNALVYYEQVFNADTTKHRLTTPGLCSLINNISIIYAISGIESKAIDILNYGLKIDPEFPTFYYNFACIYAENDDFDKLMANLEMALKYKHKHLPENPALDPINDPSFSKYTANERFIKLAKEFTK